MISVNQLKTFIENDKYPYWTINEFGTLNILADNRKKESISESIDLLDSALNDLKGYGKVSVRIGDKITERGNFSAARNYNVNLNPSNGYQNQPAMTGTISKDYLDLAMKNMAQSFDYQNKIADLKRKGNEETDGIDKIMNLLDKIGSWSNGTPSKNDFELQGVKVIIDDWNTIQEDKEYKEMYLKEIKIMQKEIIELSTKVDIRALNKLISALNDNPEHVITALKKLV